MSSDIAIKVQNLSKCYQIYDQPHDRLKQFVLPHLYRMLDMSPKNYFGEFWALTDVSFEVQKGETIGIIGRNGSGKSTLLQLIYGTLNSSSGSVFTQGRIAALLELGAGFNGEFTGRENVYLVASLHGLSHTQIDVRFESMAEFADIGAFINQPVKTYSSGMFVRLAFAIVAHLDVDILVIDEALAVGDAFFVQKCMRFLRQFAQRGTLIFVSHDVGSVLSLCDTAIWLENGRLRSAGPPKDLINEYMQALYEDPLSAIKEIETAPAKPVSPKSQTPPSTDHTKPAHQQPRDIRSELINGSTLRNDIELFPFRPDAAYFGTGHAQITDVHFDDEHGQPLSWVIGGEMVALLIDCDCSVALQSPIIGFIIKDRLGQVLFGDNTWLTSRDAPLQVEKGNQLRTRFVFIMPRLPNGDYSVSAAIAEGTITEHRQLHWMHDALTFKVNSSSVYAGLVGIPMIAIELNRID